MRRTRSTPSRARDGDLPGRRVRDCHRGGAWRAGPTRVLPLCPEPVAHDELRRGDGRATALAGTPAALNGPALEVEDLRHRYGERIALDGVSLRVERGELFGLLGPNGGGKSTLFRILSTLLAASGGAARVLGDDLALPPDRGRRRLGGVFQHASLERTPTAGGDPGHPAPL